MLAWQPGASARGAPLAQMQLPREGISFGELMRVRSMQQMGHATGGWGGGGLPQGLMHAGVAPTLSLGGASSQPVGPPGWRLPGTWR